MVIYVVLNDCQETSLVAAASQIIERLLLHRQLCIRQLWDRTLTHEVEVAPLDRGHKQLEHGQAPEERHETDLGSYPHDQVLVEDRFEHFLLVTSLDQLLLVVEQFSLVGFLQFPLALLLQGVQ